MRAIDKLAICVLLAIATPRGEPLRAADAAEPARFVADTASLLADTVTARRERLRGDPGARAALIEEILVPRFDLQTSCRLILRQYWDALSASDRQRYVGAFRRYLVTSYGSALPDFRHDTLTVHAEQEPAFGATARVRTDFVLSDGSRYRVDFYLRRGAAGWRIVDVILEGVSYVRTYRSDFGAEYRASGLDGLIDWLERTAAAKS